MSDIRTRNATAADIPILARIWFEGWQDGHLDILPKELRAVRTLDRFTERLEQGLGDVIVATMDDVPAGLVMLQADELDQFYVDAPARGTGLAAQIMAEAEAELTRRGHPTAHLFCAVGNDRAARFYEKMGWQRTATLEHMVGEGDVSVPVKVWRYEKALRSN